MLKSYSDQNRLDLLNAPANKAEGWALIELARRLDRVRQTPENKSEIRDVVRLNWRVWTIIQAAMLDPENTVPITVRSNLVNLSNFIDKRSVDILAYPDTNKLEVLININRQIGAGLLGNPAEDEEEEQSYTSTDPSVDINETDADNDPVAAIVNSKQAELDSAPIITDRQQETTNESQAIFAAVKSPATEMEPEQAENPPPQEDQIQDYAAQLEAQQRAKRAETLKKILQNRTAKK